MITGGGCVAGSTCFSRRVGVSVMGKNTVKGKLDTSIVKYIYTVVSQKSVHLGLLKHAHAGH